MTPCEEKSQTTGPCLASGILLDLKSSSFLGTLQLLQALPGNPRIGIAMDFIFFFPALFIGMISSVLLTSLWIKRDDWII
jgi:hypothetical protein